MIFYQYYAEIPDLLIEQFVTEQKLGRLITAGPSLQPHIGLYPFLYEGKSIQMHLHRDDEQLHDLYSNPKCAFEVDEVLATVPSHWIDPANAAFATAYYRCVIFECDAVISEDPQVIAAQQQRLMQSHQPEGGYAPVRAENPVYHGSLHSIAAVTLNVNTRKVKWKLAQNRDQSTRVKLIEQLTQRGAPGDLQAAQAIRRTLSQDAL